MHLYELNVSDTNGENVALSQYKGEVLLIVNTAIQCGLAPQYHALQDLYETYHDQGFHVLDFPSNQFLQSPETDEETNEHCEMNYGTTFPRFGKVQVNGKEASPVFRYLRKEASGVLGDAIKWNFTKFLVDRSGNVFKRYAPTVDPKTIEQDIQHLL